MAISLLIVHCFLPLRCMAKVFWKVIGLNLLCVHEASDGSSWISRIRESTSALIMRKGGNQDKRGQQQKTICE